MKASPCQTSGRLLCAVLVGLSATCVEGLAFAQATPASPASAPTTSAFGVKINKPAAQPGYTMVFPLLSNNTYLIDMQGRVVQTWKSRYQAGQEAYLLENGHLLRPAKVSEDEAIFAGAGQGGRVQEFTWDGELVWDYKFHDERRTQHHAITRMPNGNMLLIVWERKSAEESVEAGVNPKSAGNQEVLVDAIYEVKPKGKTGGEVVWQWHVWDHLVQDFDKSKANYGDVVAHPERINANFVRDAGFAGLFNFFSSRSSPKNAPEKSKDQQEKEKDLQEKSLNKLKGLGYVGAAGTGKRFVGFLPDWTHVNSVAYNAKLDQILLSSRTFSEIWVIDHSTTTAEAAGHVGGKYGRGGDLLYRWGNPLASRGGKKGEQQLFFQHDAHWIPGGLPGAGHVLIFSNGDRPDGKYSTVEEIELPVDSQGTYVRETGKFFGPDKSLWKYGTQKQEKFFAIYMSGAQRLPNGNTLICTGFSGSIFEVTPAHDVVWKFVNPDKGSGPALSPDRLMTSMIGGLSAGGALFRAYRYPESYAGLAGKDLAPGPTLVESVRGTPGKSELK